MTAPLSLSARIEAASCPSRELDAEIAIALELFPDGAFHMSALADPATFATGAYTSWVAPAYTSDLNAAYDLAKRLAPGCIIQVWLDTEQDVRAIIYINGEVVGMSHRDDQHLALAICAAAVKTAARGEGKK